MKRLFLLVFFGLFLFSMMSVSAEPWEATLSDTWSINASNDNANGLGYFNGTIYVAENTPKGWYEYGEVSEEFITSVTLAIGYAIAPCNIGEDIYYNVGSSTDDAYGMWMENNTVNPALTISMNEGGGDSVQDIECYEDYLLGVDNDGRIYFWNRTSTVISHSFAYNTSRGVFTGIATDGEYIWLSGYSASGNDMVITHHWNGTYLGEAYNQSETGNNNSYGIAYGNDKLFSVNRDTLEMFVYELEGTPDIINPNATLLIPSNGTTHLEAQNFTASLSDDTALDNATLYIYNSSGSLVNETLFDSLSGTEATIDVVVELTPDEYTWFVTVFDSSGNSYTTENNTVTMRNLICTILSSGNYTIADGVLYADASSPYLYSSVNISYDYSNSQSSYAGEVIDDTATSIAGVTEWFGIIIVITAMIVLILLTIIIISTIRRSDMMGSA